MNFSCVNILNQVKCLLENMPYEPKPEAPWWLKQILGVVTRGFLESPEHSHSLHKKFVEGAPNKLQSSWKTIGEIFDLLEMCFLVFSEEARYLKKITLICCNYQMYKRRFQCVTHDRFLIWTYKLNPSICGRASITLTTTPPTPPEGLVIWTTLLKT